MATSGAAARGASWGSKRGRARRVVAAKVAAAVMAAPLLVLLGVDRVSAAANDPTSDGWSMQALTQSMGVTALWDQGYTGAGIDVALIDTGISPVAGLDGPHKIVYGPDLSFESQAPNLAHLDTNGHGTFMAGLIAGHDAALTAPYSQAPASAYRGIAPDARLVSVKVGVADGSLDVTQMIAAINWVVDHRHDNGMNIRVLNLSYGTNSVQPWQVDPLAFAAERAWKAGIVVVAAAGNSGYQRGAHADGLADPAYDPTLLAVGAMDTKGTANLVDDRVGSYSARPKSRFGRAVDVVAVGSKLQGLRVPNSYIDLEHPEGRLGDRYFRGTGTSEAAAVASGTVALLLDKYPNLTPDQVKAILRTTARPLVHEKALSQGEGAVDYLALSGSLPAVNTSWVPYGNGMGSVERSRGTDHLVMGGVVLTGEQDIFGQPFPAGSAADPWSGGVWHGSVWTGSGWDGTAWAGATWVDATWATIPWSGSSWSGSSWSGSRWSGSSWSGSSWSSSVWAGFGWG